VIERHPIVVQSFGEALESALVSRWYVALGERVEAGQRLADLETDKATFEVTATASGSLAEIAFPEGATVRTGDVLGVLEARDGARDAAVPWPAVSPAGSSVLGAPAVSAAPPFAPPAVRRPPPAVWEVRVVELEEGEDHLLLEADWEPFAGFGTGRQFLARRRIR
jgi:pyruvate/2-oxoglutarate dehydrogenase complex dihydrolipoamide acyltransferase (E2) component